MAVAPSTKPIVRSVSAHQAKQQFGATINAVADDADIVVVESHGKPKVAMIPYDDLQLFLDAKEQQRRNRALKSLEEIAAIVGDRNKDLTEEQIEELARRASHDIVLGLARKGKIQFERGISYYTDDASE